MFDARIGLFDDPPSEQGTRFIQAVHGFFDYGHYLMMDVVERTLYSFADTPKFRKVCQSLDVMYEISNKFVDDKIKELDKMASRKDKSQETKGKCDFAFFFLSQPWEIWAIVDASLKLWPFITAANLFGTIIEYEILEFDHVGF